MTSDQDANRTGQDRNSQTQVKHHRAIRSFVRREGRLTSGQQLALDSFMPLYGVQTGVHCLDFKAIFKRTAPVTLEIGFGNGDSLLSMAEQQPDSDFLGIEVHRPGVGHLLKGIHDRGLTNIRVMCEDAATILKTNIADNSLNRILLLFPDPWHKKKHHKRRFIQASSIELLANKLVSDGILHLATDWQDYAEHMLDTLKASPRFENMAIANDYSQRPDYRLKTRFEQRGLRLGHEVYDLLFRRLD